MKQTMKKTISYENLFNNKTRMLWLLAFAIHITLIFLGLAPIPGQSYHNLFNLIMTNSNVLMAILVAIPISFIWALLFIKIVRGGQE